MQDLPWSGSLTAQLEVVLKPLPEAGANRHLWEWGGWATRSQSVGRRSWVRKIRTETRRDHSFLPLNVAIFVCFCPLFPDGCSEAHTPTSRTLLLVQILLIRAIVCAHTHKHMCATLFSQSLFFKKTLPGTHHF